VPITVSLSWPSASVVTVAYQTADGSAKSGSDYTAASGVLSFAPGETSQSFSVALQGDALNEPDEFFFAKLASPVGAVIGTPEVAVGIDNDDPVPSVSIADASATEGKIMRFAVTLSPASGQNVYVSYQTANGTATAGSDYRAKSGALTFSPGQTSKTVSVTVLADTIDEANESFFVNLGLAGNASLADPQAIGQILSRD
jgi:chitinase